MTAWRLLGAMALAAALAGPVAAGSHGWQVAQFQAGPADEEDGRDRTADRGERADDRDRDRPRDRSRDEPTTPGADLSGERPPAGATRS